MENVNGGLGFRATLNIDDFNVSAQAMENRIRQMSNTAISEASDMDSSILSFAQNGARYIVSYLVGQGMGSLIQSIVAVRGQFQQLEIAFETMLNSSSKANVLMTQLIDTAAKTPFDLLGLADGARRLLAFGFAADKVNETLIMLGNIASGLSLSIGDMVYLYGTTMTQGRLYARDVIQFTTRGIPLIDELSKMYGKTKEEVSSLVSEGKVGFPEVEKVLRKMTSEGGQFHNLMERQSKSLTGMIANLGDAWDVAKNKIGERNQDLFAGAIQSVTYLVEHLDDVLRIVKSITIAYGAYRAAIAINTLATKGYTGIALIDNTVRQAKIALLKADSIATGQTAAAIKTMTAAQEAHTASLQKQLSVEELSNLQKQLRIATIQSLLTAQQQEYLSNLNLTTSSAGYEAAAMGILSVEQREALNKTDLTAKSAVYRAALELEVAQKTKNQAATISAMRAEVSASAARVESAKMSAIATAQSAEAARYELYWAQKSGDVARIATAEKKLEGAQENQAIARKAALSAQTDFFAKKKALEAATTKQATVATATDTTVKAANTATTSLLTAATTKATLAMKALWASMKSNPIGWITSIVGILISALTLFSNKEDEATDAVGEFQDATRKEIDNLDVLFAVLKGAERGTKLYKEVVEKVNAICKEYNKTLLDENATIDEQRKKYAELSDAIREAASEKIKAKYIEKALQEQSEDNTKSLEKLKEAAKDAYYRESQGFSAVPSGGRMVQQERFVTLASENIRKSSDAVWDMVELSAISSADKLKSLTGKAYTDAFNQTLNQIMLAVQRSTKASDNEINSFRESVATYLSSIVGSAKSTSDELKTLDKQISMFYEPKDSPQVVEDTDYMSKSFEDLERIANDTKTEINEINSKQIRVDVDKSRLQELLELLGKVNSAISKKTASLDTEAGISDRIKALKEERANVKINGDRYRELGNEIKKLESKFPKKEHNNTSQKNDQLEQRTIEASMRLEAARIAVMEDGYKKRKAQLELQHKQSLRQIDREEKELNKARKEAGRGGLDASERKSFEERRKLQEQIYIRERVNLFDGEIEYKKSKYQAYHNWVKNVGQEVADKHFSGLIKEGSSFVSWVNNQILLLESKRDLNGGLSDGDANALNALILQQNEIRGIKSAMDLFSESVSRSINRAKTLAEKLQVITKEKKKLESGDYHLNADDKVKAYYSLSREESRINKDVQSKVLQDFRTYEEQRKSIQDEYALLRKEAEKEGNAERIEQIKKAEENALSELNAAYLRKSDSWKKLFQNLDELSIAEIERLVQVIETELQGADLKLNPVDYKAVIDSLYQAKQALIQKNPFRAIGAFLDDYIKAKEKLATAKAKVASGEKGAESDVRKAESEITKASNSIAKSINTVSNVATECGNAIAGMFSDLGEEELSETLGVGIELMGELGGAASSVAKLMAGDVIGGITGLVSSVTSLVGTFAKLNDSKYEKKIKDLQRQLVELDKYYHRLERAFNNTYWTFNSEQKEGYEKNIKLIEQQIEILEKEALVAASVLDIKRYSEIINKTKELRRQLQEAQENGDMMSIFNAQKEALKQKQEALKAQIEAEKKKKKTDNGKIQDLENQIESVNDQIEDLDKSMRETLAGTDVKSAIDEFADALTEAFMKGEDAAEALGKKTKEVMKKAVLEALKRQFLAKGIADAVNFLSDAMKDGELSDSERTEFENKVNQAGELYNKALEGLGNWIKDLDETSDPLQGAIASMSEETGGVVAGRLNSVIINQSDMLVIMRNALVYQAEIAANTKLSASELCEIKTTLRRIESGNSLLPQGIS